MSLSAYLPPDRRRALQMGQQLPDRTSGAALFADVSGFTPLTERLTQTLGTRRGIEELTRRINVVYDTLIRQVELHRGSIISFAGDAFTCWFDVSDDNPSGRAIATAQALQNAMRSIPDLAIKVAVTSGSARRFTVGDPQIQLIDALAGETIARLATAEHLASKGEIIVDTNTVEHGGETLQVEEWREDAENCERFARIGLISSAAEDLTVIAPSEDIPPDIIQDWVLPTVFAREQSGLGEFLTELRPAVVLFLRFSGINYDGDDEAPNKLHALIRQIQQIVALYEGTLLQLTIGDKGSYIYACFGAPNAHDDDARRAVRTALALRAIPDTFHYLQPVQIGISRGIMRAGAYGGVQRRAYGVLGDEVNVAARLMTLALPGEILVTSQVQELVGSQFQLEPRLPVTVKGKSNALTVFAVQGISNFRAVRLLEPVYRLPMVGRTHIRTLIHEKLDQAISNNGQIIGITGEAGMGKSRLVSEVIHLAKERGFVSYGGACESSGVNTAYLVWRPIWQAFFDLDPVAPTRQQILQVEAQVTTQSPERVQSTPLLASLLDLPIEENDFTMALEPKDRHTVLEALLEACLKSAAQKQPMLLVLEDVHWIDSLSHDLLETLARATQNTAVCLVLAYRPQELERLQTPRVETLPHFTSIVLNALPPAEADQLIQSKLVQLFPDRGGQIPGTLAVQITGKAQGNPFFIEELLNYLHDRHIDPYDDKTLNSIELPTTLHTLVLSRIDQLTEKQKATLKVASIIGRLFTFSWLHSYYPALGLRHSLKGDLDTLAKLEITPLDAPEPELAYLFKHVITHEVAYESLEYGTRAQLHEQLAQYLEAQNAEKYVDMLAFHYGRSGNRDKQRVYFQKAGEAAQANYANEAALEYYERLLPLLTGLSERLDLQLRRGAVLELMARWKDTEEQYQKVLTEAASDPLRTARAQLALGVVYRRRSNFSAALDWLNQARQWFEDLGDQVLLAQTLIEMGQIYWKQGDVPAALEILDEGLSLGQSLGDKRLVALALNNLGSANFTRDDFTAAQTFYEQSLALRREIGDKRGSSIVLSNLASVAHHRNDTKAARTLIEENLKVRREIGDRQGVASLLANLASALLIQNNYDLARLAAEEGLMLCREIGDEHQTIFALNSLGTVNRGQGDFGNAVAHHEEALILSRQLGIRSEEAYSLERLGLAIYSTGAFMKAQLLFEEALVFYRQIGNKRHISWSLSYLGDAELSQGHFEAAKTHFQESLVLSQERDDKRDMAQGHNNLGMLAYYLGSYAVSRTSFEKGLTLWHEIDSRDGIAIAHRSLGHIACISGDYNGAKKFYSQSLQFNRETGGHLWVAEDIHDHGLISYYMGDHAAARASFEESLSMKLKMATQYGVLNTLIGLAAVAHQEGDNVRTAKIATATEAQRVALGIVFEPRSVRLYNQTLQLLKSALAADVFMSIQTGAHNMTLDQLIQMSFGKTSTA